jgi:hypothetical protein
MTDDKIALRELLEKGSDSTLLREMIGFAAQRLMELETNTLWTRALLQGSEWATEALIADFRMNMPHIKVSVVMPGHIGTGIRDNSLKVQTLTDADGLNAAQIAQIRARLTSMGRDASKYSDANIERMHAERARRIVTEAPTSAAEAAKIVLDGVRADRLRILVGPNAHIIDRMVLEDPDHTYEPEFDERFSAEAGCSPGR